MASAGSVKSCVQKLLREQGKPVVMVAHDRRHDRPIGVQLASDPIPTNYHVIKTFYPPKTLTAVQRFERMAKLFYKDTGFIAPGKDVPAEIGGDEYDRERRAAWDAWLNPSNSSPLQEPNK